MAFLNIGTPGNKPIMKDNRARARVHEHFVYGADAAIITGKKMVIHKKSIPFWGMLYDIISIVIKLLLHLPR